MPHLAPLTPFPDATVCTEGRSAPVQLQEISKLLCRRVPSFDVGATTIRNWLPGDLNLAFSSTDFHLQTSQTAWLAQLCHFLSQGLYLRNSFDFGWLIRRWRYCNCPAVSLRSCIPPLPKWFAFHSSSMAFNGDTRSSEPPVVSRRNRKPVSCDPCRLRK